MQHAMTLCAAGRSPRGSNGVSAGPSRVRMLPILQQHLRRVEAGPSATGPRCSIRIWRCALRTDCWARAGIGQKQPSEAAAPDSPKADAQRRG